MHERPPLPTTLPTSLVALPSRQNDETLHPTAAWIEDALEFIGFPPADIQIGGGEELAGSRSPLAEQG